MYYIRHTCTTSHSTLIRNIQKLDIGLHNRCGGGCVYVYTYQPIPISHFLCRYIRKSKYMKELTPKEQKFLELYTDPSSNTFGNGTQSIIKAGYRVKNEKVAGIYAVRLLAKGRIKKYMEEKMSEFELDMTKHLRTLDKKISSLADEGKITREELQGYRLLGEFAGRLGGKNIAAIQVNFQNFKSGETCPYCGYDGRTVLGEGYQELMKRGRVE